MLSALDLAATLNGMRFRDRDKFLEQVLGAAENNVAIHLYNHAERQMMDRRLGVYAVGRVAVGRDLGDEQP